MLEANPTFKIQRFMKEGNDIVILRKFRKLSSPILLNFSLALGIINFFCESSCPYFNDALIQRNRMFLLNKIVHATA